MMSRAIRSFTVFKFQQRRRATGAATEISIGFSICNLQQFGHPLAVETGTLQAVNGLVGHTVFRGVFSLLHSCLSSGSCLIAVLPSLFLHAFLSSSRNKLRNAKVEGKNIVNSVKACERRKASSAICAQELL